MADVQPMSERRFLVVLVSGLGALVGLAMLLLPILELDDPTAPVGEGERIDITGELLTTMMLGGIVLIGCSATATTLLRQQLRSGSKGG